ncbi:MAG: hypothetical protein ACPGMR_03395 [Pontibacterium sp.]
MEAISIDDLCKLIGPKLKLKFSEIGKQRKQLKRETLRKLAEVSVAANEVPSIWWLLDTAPVLEHAFHELVDLQIMLDMDAGLMFSKKYDIRENNATPQQVVDLLNELEELKSIIKQAA